MAKIIKKLKKYVIFCILLNVVAGVPCSAMEKTFLHEAIERGDFFAAKVAMNFGVSVNAFVDGQTPLYCAVNFFLKQERQGSATIECLRTIKDLLSAGADVNVKDERGYSPLHYVLKKIRSISPYAFPSPRFESLASMLFQAGAMVDSSDGKESSGC